MSIAAASPMRGTRRAAGGSSEYSTVAMTADARAGGEQHLGRAWRKAHDPLAAVRQGNAASQIVADRHLSLRIRERRRAHDTKSGGCAHRALMPGRAQAQSATRVRIVEPLCWTKEAIRPCYLMEPGRRIIFLISATCASSAAI